MATTLVTMFASFVGFVGGIILDKFAEDKEEAQFILQLKTEKQL